MKEKKRTIKVKPTDYQPSKEEMEEEIRLPATSPDEVAKAMMQDVKIKYSPNFAGHAQVMIH